MKGIGIDLVEIKRIRAAVARRGPGFARRVFTSQEWEYCHSKADPYPSLAARFAAKEAVLKALGVGLGGCKFTEIEIVTGPSGRPAIKLYGSAVEIASVKGINQILISLSHSKSHAVAFAVAQKV